MKRTSRANGTSHRERIKELERDLRSARALGRTKREPVNGFGGIIQRLREKMGIGVRELAKRANVNAGLISRLEQDPKADPRLSTIRKLATGFRIGVVTLLCK